LVHATISVYIYIVIEPIYKGPFSLGQRKIFSKTHKKNMKLKTEI